MRTNENTIEPRVEILLNNNPRCDVHLENVAKGEIWDKTNIPSILIKHQFNIMKSSLAKSFHINVANNKIFIVDSRFRGNDRLRALSFPRKRESI